MTSPLDQLAIFETEVRTKGVWCEAKKIDKLSHKMVARNRKSQVAISLCGQIVTPIESLRPNNYLQHCFVCACFDVAGKETKEAIQVRLNQIADEYQEPKSEPKENQINLFS